MKWSCEYSTRKLPENIRIFFQERASFLYYDMESRRYNGELIDLEYQKYHSKQKRRSTENRNPAWYSEVYWKNTPHIAIQYSNKIRRRRGKKTLDRGRISLALKRISDSEDKDFFKYHVLMREVVRDYLINGIPCDDFNVGSRMEMIGLELITEPNNEVREFFGEKRVFVLRDELLVFKNKYGCEIGEKLFYCKYEHEFPEDFDEVLEFEKIRGDDVVPF